jgi:anti-sigma factor RsiW
MNNSDPTLTTLEEKLTAYLDGKLALAEIAEFERENPDAVAELKQHEQLRSVFAKTAPTLKNGDFFNHQILREIQPDAPRNAVPEKPAFFPLWRLAFAAAVCLFATAGIYFSAVKTDRVRGDYFAQVLSVKAGDEDISAQVIDADGVAVVWIDGLDSLPTNYVLE